MRATVERSNLLKSLGHVHRVVERRNTIPILSNVLLRADSGGLTLKATDLDLEVTESVAAEVAQPGATTVPAHILYDIVRKLAEGAEVSLDTGEGAQLALRSGRSRFSLQVLPESDFPDLTTGDFPTRFTPAGGPAEEADRPHPVRDLDRGDALLPERHLSPHRHQRRDGRRGSAAAGGGPGSGPGAASRCSGQSPPTATALPRPRSTRPEGAAAMAGVIVPRKTVGEIQKLVEDPDQEVAVELSDTKIRVTLGPVVLTSKLIDGTFPDYVRVIPQGNDKILKVDRGEFAGAVDRVSTISSERGRAVKLALADGRMVLSVNNPDSGSATEELGVDYPADAIEIGFNSRYLLDVAGQLESDTAEFRFADPGSPTLIQDDGANDALYVLMPMRV